MKVNAVTVTLKTSGAIFSFGEEAYPDLHYIVRDGMAVVNYSNGRGGRVGWSVPIEDILGVTTSTE